MCNKKYLRPRNLLLYFWHNYLQISPAACGGHFINWTLTIAFVVLRIRIRRIRMFLGLQKDPDPLVGGMDPDPAPDPSITKQKY